MDERTLDLNFCILAQPKAGSTWLVHLLSSIINKDYKFSELENIIPIITQHRTKTPYRIHNPAPAPKIKNVKLIRNPFDSCVSWRNYGKLRGRTTFNDYNFAPYYKISDNEHLVKYEELNEYPVTTLFRLCNYLEWDINPSELTEVIDKCNLHNLQKYENETLEKDGKFLFYDPQQQKRNNIRFYNKGQNYAFKEKLSYNDIHKINRQYNNFIKLHWPKLWKEYNV